MTSFFACDKKGNNADDLHVEKIIHSIQHVTGFLSKILGISRSTSIGNIKILKNVFFLNIVYHYKIIFNG